jgi:antitoxin MazE
MRSRILKCGNSLAVRIPRSLAAQARLEENAVVDMTLVDGKLVLTPQPEPQSLEKLLAGITPANCHREHDFGSPVGGEVW